MAKAKTAKKTSSTQDSLQISEIKDGLVVMRDGSLRAVVMASSVNFDLMSDQEQEAVEYAYQGFLNSLHFPIQIVIRSKRMDLDSYVDKLKKLESTQDNELLRDLMTDYIANISGMLETANIMDKQFFVVIPYFPPAVKKLTDRSSLITGLGGIFKRAQVVSLNEDDFLKYKEELLQRTLLVVNSLANINVRAAALSTQELVDLFYAFYNPDTAEAQALTDFTELQSPITTKRGEVTAAGPTASPAAPPAVPETTATPVPNNPAPATNPAATAYSVDGLKPGPIPGTTVLPQTNSEPAVSPNQIVNNIYQIKGPQ